MAKEFDDNIFPLAYLITFRCYGTWFHGNKRGSVDRRKFNTYGTAFIAASDSLEKAELSQLKTKSFILNKNQRKIVETSIKEVCKFREYQVHAVNVRSNHVHCVVSAQSRPEKVMNSFKSYSTRNLKKANLISTDEKIWARHGSTRYLWKDQHVSLAIDYVLYSQGDEFPNFDEMVG
jgi:REP element-mobilizing transposase RayT